MKIKDFVNVTKNRANNQISFNLKAMKLKEIGITPQQLLNLKISKTYIKKAKKEVKNDNTRNKSRSSY